jgi:hypothetical protein
MILNLVGISDYTNLEKLDFCKNDGIEVYQVLSSLGYEISDKNKLVGEGMQYMISLMIKEIILMIHCFSIILVILMLT